MSNIISIKRKKVENEKLYNLAVENDESFVANGVVVHNCRSILVPINRYDSYVADFGMKPGLTAEEMAKYAQPAPGFGGV
jgi:hypothetical protein